MSPSLRQNLLRSSVAVALITVFSGCYRDREARHEEKVERKEEKREERHDH
jgi:hypothetical protein